ncbi:MAG: teichoic acid transporter [Eggerthellaceae bacterium]|nr:teichoic acid transporter [Eggerthellaceae bacterium]
MDLSSKGFLDALLKSFSHTDDGTRFTQEKDGIRYLDGNALNRPLTIPRSSMWLPLIVAAIAAVIGVILAANLLGSTLHAAQRSAASVEENLARDVTLDMPMVSSLAGSDAATIKAAVDALGLNVYTVSSEEDIAAGKLDMVKMPSDVSIEEGSMYYAQGIANLDAADAALLLNGMWRLQFDAASGYNLAIRYADFDSGNVDSAVENAITAQGFDAASATQLDVDEAGNTFRSGTFDANGTTYNWRVSAISLDSVYDIAGLPDTAIYVGVRVTAA